MGFRTKFGFAALGATKLSLTLLKELTDGVPIPFVRGVAGVALEVIKATEVRMTLIHHLLRVQRVNQSPSATINSRCI